MHNQERSLVITRAYQVFKLLLLLYPDQCRKKFGQEMLVTFEDIYTEEKAKKEQVWIFFWSALVLDILKSAFEQHKEIIKKQGMKKYMKQTFHINTYNIIGSILLLPFFIVFLIDLISRIAQGDLTRYNRPVYAFLSHTFFYQTPILFIWVIFFPALAVLLNLIPLMQNSIKKHGSLFQLSFFKYNAISMLLLVVGLGFLAIIKFHDFAPCAVHGLVRFGVGKLPYIISFCSNA